MIITGGKGTPVATTLDQLADVMRSGRQREVVVRIATRDDDVCRCCEALAWEPTTNRLPCYALCGAVVAVLNNVFRALAVAYLISLRAARPHTGNYLLTRSTTSD